LSIAKQLLKDSWPLIFSAIVVMIYMRIDQIMIKEMLGEYEVGIYSAAVRLSEAFYFIPMLITASLFPAILNAKNQSDELYKQRLQRLYTFMVWMAIAIALPMTFLSDWLILLLFGQAYQEAGQVLMIHIWASIFVFLGVASGKWFITENLQRFTLINTSVGAILNVGLNLIFIPKFGIVGAAYATVISYGVAAYLINSIWKVSRSNFFMLSKSLFLFRKV
ncbi:MAG: flippase, partial [Campylobacterales bacterium]|nr:flippase [Campylobacterales bacterium]